MRNFTLNTPACNQSHAFAWSVRLGCLISTCNVHLILAHKLDIFIHFVQCYCCLNMLHCGKYFPPRATWFPGLNFILTFRQAKMTIRELQNQLLELKRTSGSNSITAALFSLQQELAKPPPVFEPYKALAGLESLVDLTRDNADTRT